MGDLKRCAKLWRIELIYIQAITLSSGSAKTIKDFTAILDIRSLSCGGFSLRQIVFSLLSMALHPVGYSVSDYEILLASITVFAKLSRLSTMYSIG